MMRKRAGALAIAGAMVAASALAAQSSARPSSPAQAASGQSRAELMANHRGGTLKLLWHSAAGTLDPQVNYTLQYWQIYQATYDGLVAFKKATGEAGFQIVPDLAVAIPKPADGGRTWTFKLRKGIKFSNGKPVTVADVVASFQRIFKVHSPTSGSFYAVLVGADKCLKASASCTLKGGVSANPRANTVTFHLTRPDAEWLDKLAVPHASILPKDTPGRDMGSKIIPGTGAYMFQSYDPNRQLVMVRNPHFKEWSADAQPDGYPDKIVQSFGLTTEAEVTQVENGQADWLGDDLPADRLNEIGTKYPSQVHVNTLTAYWYIPMNTRLAPFNNRKARQAVAYALDRNAMVRLFGGPKLAVPSCQILPPGFPGHQDYCPYSKPPGKRWVAPDMAKARQLVQESGTKGQKVALVVQNDDQNKAQGEYLQSVLNQLGYKTTLKLLSPNIQFTYIQNTKNKVQISISQWYQDYPEASDFLYVLFGCESFHPGSDTSINISGYCNPKVNARMKQALKLGVTNKDAANALWAKIDRAVTDDAPAAVMFNPKKIDFLSKRVGNYKFSKQYYMIVDQLWVQ